jgi:hypothetical protein
MTFNINIIVSYEICQNKILCFQYLTLFVNDVCAGCQYLYEIPSFKSETFFFDLFSSYKIHFTMWLTLNFISWVTFTIHVLPAVYNMTYFFTKWPTFIICVCVLGLFTLATGIKPYGWAYASFIIGKKLYLVKWLHMWLVSAIFPAPNRQIFAVDEAEKRLDYIPHLD